MNKRELKEKIKSIYNNVIDNKTKNIDLDTSTSISLDTTRFPVLVKFPTLKDVIILLLTEQYELFIKDIEWVAPRPTTFRIVLANEQPFYLIYTDRTWIGKVEGKKYYLLNLSEEQNCIESIARILSYGAKSEVNKEKITPSSQSQEQPVSSPEDINQNELPKDDLGSEEEISE